MTADKPTLFMLHALGGSSAAFHPLRQALGEGFDVVAIDFPGFGDRDAGEGTTVQEMSDLVADAIRARGASHCLLVGHSMGGKIATVVASRALRGERGLFGLMGVILLAGSPPSPEPMDEERREQMIGWVRRGPMDDKSATTFLDANVGAPLRPMDRETVLTDLKRSSPLAWRAWLERGSREDWSTVVGTLPLPALVIVGSEDADLGEAGQRATNMHVYARATLRSLDGAGHLLPLEKTAAVAATIRDFVNALADRLPAMPPGTATLVNSDRVTRRTRALLAQRAIIDASDASDASDAPDATGSSPGILTPRQLTTLRAVAGRVVPQREPAIDLAARLDLYLAEGGSDGWRFADMPGDNEAYVLALDALSGFESMDRSDQDKCIDAIVSGHFATDDGGLDTGQMQNWFEDVRNDLIRLWIAHPATAGRLGFHGFANGGDLLRPQGFDQLSAGERDAWERAI